MSEAVAEGVPNRAERDQDVEILSTPVHKERKQCEGAELSHLVPGLRNRPHHLQTTTQQRHDWLFNLLDLRLYF